MYRVAPLSASFMLSSIIGGTISAMYIYPRSPPWGFTFFMMFVLMFIASMISMTYAPIEIELDADIRREKERRKLRH
ncbi:MAG: hypothetical protein Q7S65_04780 [Nanoarchaeota archaeon]|nr:hypothetical protein [Nanoarchaeota archaeon]